MQTRQRFEMHPSSSAMGRRDGNLSRCRLILYLRNLQLFVKVLRAVAALKAIFTWPSQLNSSSCQTTNHSGFVDVWLDSLVREICHPETQAHSGTVLLISGGQQDLKPDSRTACARASGRKVSLHMAQSKPRNSQRASDREGESTRAEWFVARAVQRGCSRIYNQGMKFGIRGCDPTSRTVFGLGRIA